ncbi:MAG TPA: outer membrane beta-barrel protein [Chitinophagaceae bacterium]|nr:outer membrane beta-barrel protein [Chitinophagaceae bacterium]
MLHIQRKKVIKIITLFAFVSVICTSARSQIEMYQLEHETKPYYFGITLGANIARFQIEHHQRFLQYDSVLEVLPLNSPGFQLGLNATARLTNRFEVRFNPQLMFTDRSITYKLKYKDPIDGFEPTKKIESVIFSFPFQIKFNSDRIGNFRVYMMGGAFSQIDLAANARARRAEDLVKLERSDYGVEIGMGFNFYFPSFILSPEVKVSNGLRNIHSRDQNLKYSNVIDRIQSRMIVFSIHLEG